MAEKIIKVKNEFEMKKWFEKNFEKLGYSQIIKRDGGIFPDFVMLKDGKKIRVELETISSNFLLHNHDINKVDEVVCIEKNINLDLPIVVIDELEYGGGKKRISATIDKKTKDLLEAMMKNGKYRNMSHLIETAIKFSADELMAK